MMMVWNENNSGDNADNSTIDNTPNDVESESDNNDDDNTIVW